MTKYATRIKIKNDSLRTVILCFCPCFVFALFFSPFLLRAVCYFAPCGLFFSPILYKFLVV